MACILKIPSRQSKGVVTFTTQEWRIIHANSELVRRLEQLRTIYVTGLHFNWHDYKFDPPALFDFFMAGEGDLVPINNKPLRLLPMDACNFTPAAYAPTPLHEKYWDVLIVGNPVFFKRPEIALNTIRDLFDRSDTPLRVLYICPIPQYQFLDEDTVLYDIRDYYEAMFTVEERQRFMLLTTNFDSPNPFDRETLSVFFKNSKVFLHCAVEERRCRIAAYAWSAGLPVIAKSCVASILPEDLRQMPGYFEVKEDEEYADSILRALALLPSFNPQEYRGNLSESYTVDRLKDHLSSIFEELNIPFHGKLLGQNLDRRLGWHHQAIGGLTNGLSQGFAEFFDELEKLIDFGPDRIIIIESNPYPERVIANEFDNVISLSLSKVVAKSIYLNPKKRKWMALFKHLKNRLLH